MRCVQNAINNIEPIYKPGLNIVQNLPFLVNQNSSPKQASPLAVDQKAVEPSGTSFKQVLSQQVQANGKDKPHSQIKTQKLQAQTHQPQTKSLNSANQDIRKVGSGKADIAEKANLVIDAEQMLMESEKYKNLVEEAQAENVTIDPAPSLSAMMIQQMVNAGSMVKEPSAKGDFAQTSLEGSIQGLGLERSGQVDSSVPMTLKSLPSQQPNETDSFQKQLTATSAASVEADGQQVANDERLTPSKSPEGAMQLSEKLQGKQEQMVINASTELAMTSFIQASQSAQQTAAAQIQTASSNVIDIYPGKTGWDQAISQRIVWMVGAAEQSATLTLNPPDLGPLQVVINVNNEKADTTFISENPEVRKALEDGIPALRDLMGQAGVQLGQTNVSSGKEQDFQQTSGSPKNLHPTAKESSAEDGNNPAVSKVMRAKNGLVDTFA